MPKYNSFPVLFDEVVKIDINKLKEWGYLEPYKTSHSSYNWWRGETKRASIGFYVNMNCSKPFIELDYKFNDMPKKYNVRLVSVPSNLGKGLIWYFLCPYTNKRCRFLYHVYGYFAHRDTFKDAYYEKQIISFKRRTEFKLLEDFFGLDHCYEELYSKHFKKTYAGKPTKRYLKLLERIKRGERYNRLDLERMLVR